MAINLLTISLFGHILFVIAWMFTIPIMAIIERAASKVEAVEEKFKIFRMSSINTKISLISAILVFLTGAIMTTILNAWAPDGSFWLEAKQTIWLLLLIAAVFLMRPLDNKMHQLMDDGAPLEEVKSVYKTLKIRSHILTTFILINILLATTKPF